MSQESNNNRALLSPLGPAVYGFALLAMNVAFVAAGLAALYLLAALFFGHLGDFSTVAKAEQGRILSNLHLATQVLIFGLGGSVVFAGYVYWSEETVGYMMLGGAALMGLGIPFGFTAIGGEAFDPTKSQAIGTALSAFPAASLAPGGVAAILIGKDIITRAINAIRNRPVTSDKMAFGQGAQFEAAPQIKNVPLGKCWQGPYCREAIRAHCPIFIAKKACWRERRGCYCEEDIVTSAMTHGQGIQLNMAPDARYNFANPINAQQGSRAVLQRATLTAGQKRERCRNCIIYNQHQREKYDILMPVVLIGSLVFCAVFYAVIQGWLGNLLVGAENLLGQISFVPGGEKAVKVTQPSPGVALAIYVALVVMLVSKALQVMEWAIFKAKI